MECQGLSAARRLAAALALTLLVVPPAFAARADEGDGDRVTFELSAGTGELSGGRRWDASGVTGTATLTARGDQTLVELEVQGGTGDHPDHIHRGRCADPEPNPLYPLTDVVLSPADRQGHSETTVDVPLSELRESDYLILVHESAQKLNVYLACGDIVAEVPEQMPHTGVGSAAQGSNRALLAGLCGAAALTLSALAARRRPTLR